MNPTPLLVWILVLGGTGFAAGFFGPMVFAPEANQGPLVGIFISGPLATVLSLILFAVTRLAGVAPVRQWQTLWASSAIAGLVTLYFCMPEPALTGYIVETQVQDCKSPAQVVEEAIESWKIRISRVTWAQPRPGWQEDARRSVKDDPGVVLDVTRLRTKYTYEGRKPWNRGSLSASGWDSKGQSVAYYTRIAGGSCDAYPAGSRSISFIAYTGDRGSGGWPPWDVASFLDLATLGTVPSEYRRFAGN